jgi:His/Glu/Gln/Arg/opine family amino acid ABC transporter permease subunit
MSYLFAPEHWSWLFSGRSFLFLLEGFAVTIEIALVSMFLAMIVGLVLALGRISKNPVTRWASGMWIDVWRNLPLIFILLFLSLWLPAPATRSYENIVPDFMPEAWQSGRILAAVVGLVLYNSAVIAEIMRAGIVSLERGQGEAAAALGLSYWKAMRLIILPQGLRRMVPATVSQLITLNKDTTLVSIIAIQEVMRHGRILSNCNVFTCGRDIPLLQVFLVVGGLFVIVNLGLSRLSRRLEIRQREKTGTEVEAVTGLEDQVAAQADVRK